MICGNFNARSSLWDQHDTNQQGCALEAALSDVLFTPVSTANATHPGTQQGDIDSTIDLALVSPKLVPWTSAETLPSHRSGHLPVVFSLQKPGIEPRRKPHYPFQCGKSKMGCDVKAASSQASSHNKSTTESRHPATLMEQGNSGSGQADNGETVAKWKEQATSRPNY